MCGLEITTESGRVTNVRGDDADVFSRGHLCPKGAAIGEQYDDPDRVRVPLRRRPDGRFEAISWEAALDFAVAGLEAARRAHGRNGVAFYIGNPTVHNHSALILSQAFARGLGTRNLYDANSLDANPRLLASLLLYGAATAVPIPDVDHTDFLLMLGANPAASNGSLLTMGDVRGRLKGIRARGARLVLVDPRRTETAEWATEHHFIRPGGDAAFLLGIVHTLFQDGLVDSQRVSAIADGLDDVKRAVAAFPPERVAARCGVDADVIRRLARELAAAKSAAVYGRIGTCLNEFGTTASWLIDVCNVITGNFDRRGGVLFPSPAADPSGLAKKLGVNRYARWRSRVRGLPEFTGALPTAALAEEITTPGEGQVRALVTLAGNPARSAPDSGALEKALASLDHYVAIDTYINETTRHAHVILPPVHALERGHFDLLFHGFAVRNTVKYSVPVFPKPADGREEWEILYTLGMRLGGLRFGIPVLDRTLHLGWKAGIRLDPDRVIDHLLRTGAHGDRYSPLSKGLNLAKLKQSPHGIDLGPLKPGAAPRIAGGRVALAPELLLRDLERVAADLEASSVALVLIGRRHVRSNNSWMHNVPSLVRGKDRATAWVHPTDAAAAGVVNGQRVRVTSSVGSIEATAEVTEDVMRGVVSIPHGFGHGVVGDTLRVAAKLAGPNLNDVTDSSRVDAISGTAALNGTPIRLSAAKPASRARARPSRAASTRVREG